MTNLEAIAATLTEQEIGQKAVDQGIDTTTPGGRLFHMIAAIAELERDLVVERTHDGPTAARARTGRRPTLTPTQVTVARSMYDSRQHTLAQIAQSFGVTRSTIYRHLDPERQAPRRAEPDAGPGEPARAPRGEAAGPVGHRSPPRWPAR